MDASEECMRECKAKYSVYEKPVVPGKDETADQARARAKAPLIKKLLDSKCCRESDRSRLEKSEIKGLIAELCGCECSGHFPFSQPDAGGGPDTHDLELKVPKA